MPHNDLYDSLKNMFGEKMFLELNAKMLLANQIEGIVDFNISKTICGIKLIFCMELHIY